MPAFMQDLKLRSKRILERNGAPTVSKSFFAPLVCRVLFHAGPIFDGWL